MITCAQAVFKKIKYQSNLGVKVKLKLHKYLRKKRFHECVKKEDWRLTLSRKQSLSLVLASRISTSKKTTAFLVFLAGLRLLWAWTGSGAGTTAPLATLLLPVASNARASMSTVLLLLSVYSRLPLSSLVTLHLSNVYLRCRLSWRRERRLSAVEINLSLPLPLPFFYSPSLPPCLHPTHSFTSVVPL